MGPDDDSINAIAVNPQPNAGRGQKTGLDTMISSKQTKFNINAKVHRGISCCFNMTWRAGIRKPNSVREAYIRKPARP